MSNLAFLLAAVGVSIVASLWLWWRNRKPTAFMHSIDAFHREMDALSFVDPDDREPRGPRASAPEVIVPAPESGDLAQRLRDARRLRGDDLDVER